MIFLKPWIYFVSHFTRNASCVNNRKMTFTEFRIKFYSQDRVFSASYLIRNRGGMEANYRWLMSPSN